MFNSADAAVITKMDWRFLAASTAGRHSKNINEIRPGIRIFETSVKDRRGAGGVAGVSGGSAGWAGGVEGGFK